NKTQFIEKAEANGAPTPTAEAIWALIANFAEYAYCKAHASTYGELAYQCAYLKAHFPAEFLVGVLTNRGGFYHPSVYIEEVRRHGIEVRPPDVNRSALGYTIEDEAVRVGLLEIQGVLRETLEALTEARKEGLFHNVDDLCRRTGIPYSDAQTLIDAGACDGLGRTRPELRWELAMYRRSGARAASGGEERLLAEPARPPVPHLPDCARRQRVEHEREICGFVIATHPIECFISEVAERPLVSSRDMAAYARQRATLLGWLIAERRVGLKGRGAMKFLTFEDPAGVFEAVLFPRVYQRCGYLLTSQGPYLVTGQIQEENHYCSVIVDDLERIGHEAKHDGISSITPPLRWIVPEAGAQE
ncbi:MAG TPA: hypothetical protein ENN80_09165, partial [Candidatus Hydrogenedentes bacterium]|nr:hypothetical protein [Candidatus Hydrogenedentota bacterium]